MVQWMRNLSLPFQIVLTKGDRLSGNERRRAVADCGVELGLGEADAVPLLTSARDRSGIPEMWRAIEGHLEGDRARPVANPATPTRPGRAGEGGR
jgi:GTP-binding protein EngB required for normal cell division